MGKALTDIAYNINDDDGDGDDDDDDDGMLMISDDVSTPPPWKVFSSVFLPM